MKMEYGRLLHWLVSYDPGKSELAVDQGCAVSGTLT
jgi:hypothetical protein